MVFPSCLHIQHQSRTQPPSSKIICCKNSPQRYCPKKETNLRRDFWPPHTFPREKMSRSRKEHFVKRFNLKYLARERIPGHTISLTMPYVPQIDPIHKQYRFQFLILDHTNKTNILMASSSIKS